MTKKCQKRGLIIVTNYLLYKDRNYYLQMFLKDCEYIRKEKH